MSEVVLRAERLHKSYSDGTTRVTVLQGAELELRAGERLAIVGRSGSGKSTLLHVLAGLDDPDEGSVWITGEEMNRLKGDARAQLRNRSMGFVYQFHHLLPEYSALENVAMPLLLGGHERSVAAERAELLLARVDLSTRRDHRPHQLSGGERQRIAVARALASEPAVVLADEPTGNLDRDNAGRLAALMGELSEESGTAFIVVTHDEHISGWAQRLVTLEAGVLREL